MENSCKEEGELLSDYEGFETDDDSTSNDSEKDPSFELLEDTRSRLSNISLKKTRPRVGKTDVGSDEDEDDVRDVKVTRLNAKDAKSFEEIEKKIKEGQLDKLKVDQCKIYLRKHGLRLTGNKDVLLGRIREHLEVIDGGGEQKYPASSFVLNCQGDACTGDIVMFEQKVYEMFSIASRSATGPPCGTRTIAGRIVKESYGAAKQQHTFTIEVLWSKGEKPFSPLHPLLIKGRNLYRLKTLRQKWANEDDRRRVLQEKHDRGFVARTSRERRIQQKEMRKNHTRHGKNNIENMPPMISRPPQSMQLQNQQPHISQAHTGLPQVLSSHHHNNQANSSQEYKGQVLANGIASTQIVKPMTAPPQHHNHAPTKRREPALHNTINTSSHTLLPPIQSHADFAMPAQSTDKFNNKQVLRDSDNIRRTWTGDFSNNQTYASGYGYHDMRGFGIIGYPPRRPAHNSQSNRIRNPLHNRMVSPQRRSVQREICRYYPQGRCHFMDNCKFLHE